MLAITHHTLINDLAIVIVCAAIVSFIFHRFNIPVILGYLLAGLIVGPNTFYESLVRDETSINELSELGVAFLMFYIGLEFDLGKLRQVMSSAFIAISFQTVVMILLGIWMAPLLGWSDINGLFLGGVLAISSTMVTVSVLREQESFKEPHAQIVIGMLLFEDIVAILLLVILTGTARSGEFAWTIMWKNVFFVGVFVMIVFYLGRLIVPSVLNRLKKFGSDELTSLVVVGLLLGIGILAQHFEFSIALGSFLAGALLSQSSLVDKIESTTTPLRNLFNAIFFVTVGMLIEPAGIIHSWLPIVTISIFVIIGKSITAFLGLLLSGQNPRASFRAAICKSQIGEFSFIISALGNNLGVADYSLNTLSVGVGLITITITPLLHSNSCKIYTFISSKSPNLCRRTRTIYLSILKNIYEFLNKITLLDLIKKPIYEILIHLLLFSGTISISSITSSYTIKNVIFVDYAPWPNVFIWLLAGPICLPCLSVIIRNLDRSLIMTIKETLSSGRFRQITSAKLCNVFYSLSLCFVSMALGGVYLSASASHLPSGFALISFLFSLLGFISFFWKKIIKINFKPECLFYEKIDGKIKDTNESRKQNLLKKVSDKYPWSIELNYLTIKSGTIACGHQIINLELRSVAGVSVIALSRGGYTIYSPDPEILLFPDDRLILTGDRVSINRAICMLNKPIDSCKFSEEGDVEWDTVYISNNSNLAGETLSGLDLRNKYKINVVGIQRGKERKTFLKSDDLLLAEDLILIVGFNEHINTFKQKYLLGDSNAISISNRDYL